jgi:cell division transport system permease protein
MFGRRSDLPLRRDATSRFLPWIIAVMVYLAALSLAGAIVLGEAITAWSKDLTGTLTVQIPISEGEAEATEARVAKAVDLLRRTPGIARVSVLDKRQMGALLEPWLGPDIALSKLPLPKLIDVTLAEGAKVDTVSLGLRLTAIVPDAVIDDHRKWLDELLRLARSIELVSVVVVVLIALAAVATVVFAARAGLAVHRSVIEIMHVIGARDSFVAAQFQRQALVLGFWGGVAGLLAAVATLLALGRVAGRVQAIDALQVSLSPLQWAMLAALPPAAAIIAMVTARLTVMRTLARLP